LPDFVRWWPVRLDHPEPADRPGQPTADHPLIPNGSSRVSSDRHPPDIPDIPKTADYRAAVDAAYREYAIDQGCTRVREIEEHVVTPAMRRIEAEDPNRHLVGLDHRLKGEARLTEKVTNWLKADATLTYETAFGLVKDAIRYTFQYPDDRYADGVRADCERFKNQGFEPVDLKNSWSEPEYKGINSRWRAPESGQLFEVQFHTQASFKVKEETHSAYEPRSRYRRGPPTSRTIRRRADASEDHLLRDR
jgi:hypothetical protein